ncbi:MAG TPA: phosphoribosylaminoimidazolesuccinocarboxamide synthase [Methanocella sp.]|nr:phosphoribosylaminoimidazolesuccinocarboxamide synthase [Methanocella sp.]
MIIAKGKTKIVKTGPEPDTVLLETQDVLTGGDAAKKETIERIGIHKTTQAANVFSLLNRKGLDTAFIRRASPNELLCYSCDMLPLELVIRRYAWGSYLYRNPGYRGDRPHRFETPVREIFHKMSVVAQPITNKPYQLSEEEARARFLRDGKWQEGVYTDPYVEVVDGHWLLYPAKKPVTGKPLMEAQPPCTSEEFQDVMDKIMLPTFLTLEEAWRKISTTYGPVALVDLKIEVGRRTSDGKIVIADVIDNDSWRIWPGADPAKQLDKQCFRDDNPLSKVAENYTLVADLTNKFLSITTP